MGLNTLLSFGSTGPNVKEIQTFLGLKPTGVFDAVTKNAVIAFQKKHGLLPDGIVGPKTYGALVSELNDLDSEMNVKDDRYDEIVIEDDTVINEFFLDDDEYVKDYGKIDPVYLFIHHTSGWNNPYNTVKNWNNDSRGRIGTQYVIGGTNIKTEDDTYDGVIVQAVPDGYFAWHLGKVGNRNMSINSIGIELNNFGYLIKKGNSYYTYTGAEVPQSMVCDLGDEFRGHRYWHAYTNKQMRSLKKLIQHISKKYKNINIKAGIPEFIFKNGESPIDAFEFKNDAYYGKIKGLLSHSNVRRDKTDCSPQPNLIKILEELFYGK